MTNIDKLKYQQAHATQRAMERFGIQLDDYEYFKLVEQIYDNKATFLMRTSKYRTIWIVKYDDEELCAVYNKKEKTIVTFLNKGMVRRKMKRRNLLK